MPVVLELAGKRQFQHGPLVIGMPGSPEFPSVSEKRHRGSKALIVFAQRRAAFLQFHADLRLLHLDLADAALIRSFSKPGDVVLDPFSGSGSTSVAAALNGRRYVGIELERKYCAIARARLARVERRQMRRAA